MLEHNIHEYVKHSKELLKKPAWYKVLSNPGTHQTKIISSVYNSSEIFHTLREMSSLHLTMECSNQSTQHTTEQPEISEDNQEW